MCVTCNSKTGSRGCARAAGAAVSVSARSCLCSSILLLHRTRHAGFSSSRIFLKETCCCINLLSPEVRIIFYLSLLQPTLIDLIIGTQAGGGAVGQNFCESIKFRCSTDLVGWNPVLILGMQRDQAISASLSHLNPCAKFCMKKVFF